MKKLILIPIIIVLAIGFFLFWPEIRYDTDCDPNYTDPNGGCAPLFTYDYSDFRFRGGISWLEQQNVCIKTDADCRPIFPEATADPAPYTTSVPLMLAGGLGLATILTSIGYFMHKRLSHKRPTTPHR